MPHNQSNHYLCRPGDTVFSFGPAGEVQSLPRPRNQCLLFFFVSACLYLLGRVILFSPLFSLLVSSLIAVTSPPCCLLPLPLRPSGLFRQDWKISATILRLSGKPHRLHKWVLPSGTRPPWRKAWAGACCQSLMAKRVVR